MADENGAYRADRLWWFRHPYRAVRWLILTLRGGSWSYEYDFDADASYLRVRRGKSHRTYCSPGNGEMYAIDVDRWGNTVGIEFLGVRKHTPSWAWTASTGTGTAQTITVNPQRLYKREDRGSW